VKNFEIKKLIFYFAAKLRDYEAFSCKKMVVAMSILTGG